MNPSMLPVQVVALSYDGKDITQLSDFVNDTLSPKLEGITGVASVTVSGTVERQLHVILSQKKLDALSQRLSDAIAKQLNDAAGQLASARGQVNSAKAAIRSAEESAVRDAVTQALTTIQDSLKPCGTAGTSSRTTSGSWRTFSGRRPGWRRKTPRIRRRSRPSARTPP